MAKGVENYLHGVLSITSYKWDKSSTTPPNKLKEIFDLINIDIKKIQLFKWNDDITTSLRAEKDYHARQSYIRSNLHVLNLDTALKGKNIIVLDDQLTTGATLSGFGKNLKKRKLGISYLSPCSTCLYKFWTTEFAPNAANH